MAATSVFMSTPVTRLTTTPSSSRRNINFAVGVRAESKSSGLMTSDAELWNGRAAMLGLVALAFTEYVTGSPLV
ncbi:putative chlorophyll A-B binding protein [Helianthus debilis subsp. tardiflorus]